MIGSTPENRQTEAQIVAQAVIKGFLTIPWDVMPRDAIWGAMLLYEQLLLTTQPHLPLTPATEPIFALIHHVTAFGDRIRVELGLPKRP